MHLAPVTVASASLHAWSPAIQQHKVVQMGKLGFIEVQMRKQRDKFRHVVSGDNGGINW